MTLRAIKRVRVRSSGQIVTAQIWETKNGVRFWLDSNWYSPDAFEEIK